MAKSVTTELVHGISASQLILAFIIFRTFYQNASSLHEFAFLWKGYPIVESSIYLITMTINGIYQSS